MWQSWLSYPSSNHEYQAIPSKENHSDYQDLEYREEDLEAFDGGRMTLTTKLSIDQLVERINNSNDIFEYNDSIETPRDETREP